MASEATNGVGCSHSHHDVWKSPKRCMCASSMFCRNRKKKEGLCISRNVFQRRGAHGVTTVKTVITVKSSTALLHHLPVRYCLQRIHSIAIICFYMLVFVFAALFLVFLAPFILPCRTALPVSTLFVPFVAQGGNCCCGFLSRYVPRIHSFHFYLASGPFVTRIRFQFVLFKISVAPPEMVKWLRRHIQSLRNSE